MKSSIRQLLIYSTTHAGCWKGALLAFGVVRESDVLYGFNSSGLPACDRVVAVVRRAVAVTGDVTRANTTYIPCRCLSVC
jgi:hypothetical protein